MGSKKEGEGKEKGRRTERKGKVKQKRWERKGKEKGIICTSNNNLSNIALLNDRYLDRHGHLKSIFTH